MRWVRGVVLSVVKVICSGCAVSLVVVGEWSVLMPHLAWIVMIEMNDFGSAPGLDYCD